MKDYIGKKIREARKAAGLTQAQLAEKSGVAAITIHQYEAGKRQPRVKQLADIAAALNISVDSLLTFEAPIVDAVEVRHGRWEHNDDGYGCEDLWWCSACKEKFVLIEGTPRDNGYYYCPNCGAKMDGGADE